MPYCTEANIIEAIGKRAVVQATCDAGSQSINSVRLAAFIANSDAEINTYFAGCAKIPIGPVVPSIVKDLSVRLTVYQLLRKNNQAEITDGIKQWRDTAIEQLKMLNNKCHLLTPIPDPPDDATKSNVGLRVQSSTKIFDASRLKQMPI